MQGHADIILSYRSNDTKGKEGVEMNLDIFETLFRAGCFHVVAGSLTCTCTPVVDVSFVQAAPWFPGL